MAKKEIDQNIQEIKSALDAGKAIIGKDRVFKGLNNGTVTKVFVCKNLPDEVSEDLEHYSNLAKVAVVPLNYDNEELGVLAKKNFFVSMIGISA